MADTLSSEMLYLNVSDSEDDGDDSAEVVQLTGGQATDGGASVKELVAGTLGPMLSKLPQASAIFVAEGMQKFMRNLEEVLRQCSEIDGVVTEEQLASILQKHLKR